MLDHVQADDQLEAGVGERELEHRAGDHLADVALARQRDAGLGQLDAGNRPATGELDHVAPAAATGVEDPRALGERQRVDHAVEHGSSAPIPPVAVLRLVGLSLVVPIHPRASFHGWEA